MNNSKNKVKLCDILLQLLEVEYLYWKKKPMNATMKLIIRYKDHIDKIKKGLTGSQGPLLKHYIETCPLYMDNIVHCFRKTKDHNVNDSRKKAKVTIHELFVNLY